MRIEEVFECTQFAHEFAEKHGRKLNVQQNAIVNGNTKQNSDETKFFFGFDGARRKPIVLCLFVVLEEGFEKKNI